jgi:hypothetical protein
MKEKFIDQMIVDYDRLIKIPRESYDLVIPILKLVTKQRGECIKAAGDVDVLSRYICDGFIGYYNQTNDKKYLFAIYQPSDTVFDFDSYRTGIPSQNELISISKVTYLEFPIEAENEVINKDLNLMRLALLVNQRISNRQSRVHEISKMEPEIGYPILLREFKGIGMALTVPQFASFFHVSERTINRVKRALNS